MHPPIVKCSVILMSALVGCVSHQDARDPQYPFERVHDWRAEPHLVSTIHAVTFEEDASAYTLGIDYEYRLTDFLGIGAVAEYAFGDIDAMTIFAAADLHLTSHIIIQAGPGVEFVDSESEPMFRVGVLYEFQGNGYKLRPQLHYDWSSATDSIIVGLAFGVAF